MGTASSASAATPRTIHPGPAACRRSAMVVMAIVLAPWVGMPRVRSQLRRFPAADEGIEAELALRRARADREPVAARVEGERDDHAPAKDARSGRRDRGREPVVDEHLGGAVGRDLEREGGAPIHLLEACERDAVGDVADTPAVDVSLQRALPPGAARVAR